MSFSIVDQFREIPSYVVECQNCHAKFAGFDYQTPPETLRNVVGYCSNYGTKIPVGVIYPK